MQTLCDILHIEHPIIMAPMFLVSNEEMVVAALQCGITAAIPAANYRKKGEIATAIASIKAKTDKPFGINLVVNKSNTRYKQQLAEIVEAKPAFVITSLGSPSTVTSDANTSTVADIKLYMTFLPDNGSGTACGNTLILFHACEVPRAVFMNTLIPHAPVDKPRAVKAHLTTVDIKPSAPRFICAHICIPSGNTAADFFMPFRGIIVILPGSFNDIVPPCDLSSAAEIIGYIVTVGVKK
ncbi:MAG: nitronate monooxygenase [Bacteroidales bacterium]|nr:nitronate monooxygenase [Bacteroidales bacterium]